MKHDESNEQLKEALKNCKDNVEMPSFNTGMPGGAFNPFADPKLLANLAMNPKTRDILKDPEVMGLITSLQKNPNDIGKLLNHPKASMLLGALLGGMGGMGGGAPGMFGGEDEGGEMDFESKQNTQSEPAPKAKPKEEEKPDLSEEQRNFIFKEKY